MTTPRLFNHFVQTSYLVDDVEQATLGWWQTLGVGPWFVADRMDVTEYRYRGRDIGTLSLAVAMTYVGGVQLELIRPLPGSGPSLFDEFIHAGRLPAMHHIAFMEPDYDATYAAALKQGMTVAHEGNTYRGRLAYFDHPAIPGGLIELCEPAPERVRIYQNMARICASWDGKEPIRRQWPTD